MEIYNSKDWHDTTVRLKKDSGINPTANKNPTQLTAIERYSLTNSQRLFLNTYNWMYILPWNDVDVTDPARPDNKFAGWEKLLAPVPLDNKDQIFELIDTALSKRKPALSRAELAEFKARYITPYEYDEAELEHARLVKRLIFSSSLSSQGLPFMLEKITKADLNPYLIFTRGNESCTPVNFKAEGMFTLCEHAQSQDGSVEHDEDNPLIAAALTEYLHYRYSLRVVIPLPPTEAWSMVEMMPPQGLALTGSISYINRRSQLGMDKTVGGSSSSVLDLHAI